MEGLTLTDEMLDRILDGIADRLATEVRAAIGKRESSRQAEDAAIADGTLVRLADVRRSRRRGRAARAS